MHINFGDVLIDALTSPTLTVAVLAIVVAAVIGSRGRGMGGSGVGLDPGGGSRWSLDSSLCFENAGVKGT